MPWLSDFFSVRAKDFSSFFWPLIWTSDGLSGALFSTLEGPVWGVYSDNFEILFVVGVGSNYGQPDGYIRRQTALIARRKDGTKSRWREVLEVDLFGARNAVSDPWRTDLVPLLQGVLEDDTGLHI